MHQIDLTEEERQKLRELWMSPEFKKARKAMKRSFYLEESPVLPFFYLVLHSSVFKYFSFSYPDVSRESLYRLSEHISAL